MTSDTYFQQRMREAERHILKAALIQTKGNRMNAAVALGIHHQTLERKLRFHGLNGNVS